MAAKQQNPCVTCALKALCMARDLDVESAEVLGRAIRHTRSLEDQTALFWQGDSFHGLYAVRSGVVKSVFRDENGEERVRGFYFPGELVGLDALHQGKYPATAETLGNASFCVLSYTAIEQLVAALPQFGMRMISMMSRELGQARSLAGEYTADQRLAAFLLELADRMAVHTGVNDQYTLEMSRSDMANYLRLVPETISRVLGRFGKQGLIEVKRRHVRILDRKKMKALAAPMLESVGPQESLLLDAA